MPDVTGIKCLIWENFKGVFFMDGGEDLSSPLSFILFFFFAKCALH